LLAAGRIAWIAVCPLAHELVEAVELRPRPQVLDVACGTGHVALEAARVICEVTGDQLRPELVEVACRQDPRSNVRLPAAGRN
jgi:2-polyprenyl-3-methyl-5-hydroxy-6-metoxy-1,4-benzoquinol methylase